MELTFSDRVIKLINEMNIGDEFSINQKVHPNNREMFIDAVKYFIRSGFTGSSWIIEIKSDYSAIRKIKNIINQKKTNEQRTISGSGKNHPVV